MRILHCCLSSFYIDGYSYQENILPREHKKCGHDVRILASTETFVDNNALGYISPGSYLTEDGIPVTRLPYSKLLPHFIMKKLRMYRGVEKFLYDFKPEIIFLHDLQFLDIRYFAKYARKYPETKIYIDCHADFSNSARTWFSKNILHGIIYRYCAKVIEPYTITFWGVLPARVDFLKNMYKLPPEKVKLLVMGAEDDKVEEARDEKIRKAIREKYQIGSDDFLIITGGKIDSAKRQTLLLMEAVQKIKDDKVKLIVFGSVASDMLEEFNMLCDNDRIKYIGWIKSNDTYKIFAAADLVVFPGRHSVFWEQVVGLGIPMVVKYWDGTTHVDLGGNCEFLYKDSADEIYEKLMSIVYDGEKLSRMRNIAETKGMKYFSYREISSRAIDCAE